MTAAEGMAKVMAGARCKDVHGHTDGPTCESCRSWGTHVADALAAAGYGDVREAEAALVELRTIDSAKADYERGRNDARNERHDDQCESEYEPSAHTWTPCGCWASRSEAQGLVAHAEKAEAKTADLLADLKALADKLGEPDSWNSLSEDSFPHVINRINALIAKYETGRES